MSARCDYYGNQGSNLSIGYCQNAATWDRGRRTRVVGLPYMVRYSCDEHAPRLIDYKQRLAAAASNDDGPPHPYATPEALAAKPRKEPTR